MDNKIKVGRSILETITVALYENPIILFREYVQNSLDAYNRARDEGENIIKDFHVAINIDKKCKKIVITDNGYGIETNGLFKDRMSSIGSSEKLGDRTKYIGFRGIGRISGLSFCKRLTFKNKAKNSNKIQKCTWEGEKYRKLLDNEDAKEDLQSIIKKIVTFEEENTGHENKSDHYFEVTLEEYSNEIEIMIGENKFKEKLIRMLPLKYNDSFKGASKIINKYKSFMNESLERFMVVVKYNGEDLLKTYDNKFILGSDVVFWEIRGKQKRDGSVGDKIGLLWFTFDRHLKSNNNDEYYGILTRSKNILMGANDTFAQVANDNKEYVTTFREMAQSLRGIYGELLINSPFLRDNSRRDWFLPDQYSMDLNNIITDFMRRLHNYRYCASRYFRAKPSKKQEDLKKALDELVNIKDNQIDYSHFYKKETEEEKEIDKELFSEQDIPHENQSLKKCYDILMRIIEEYFNKTKNRVLFLKLRAHIVNRFKKK
jgi:molecular chaperone HtpG